MLQSIKEIYGHQLAAADGEIGHVKDFYFDDKTWAVRYLVADTGTWLAERLVLLSPHSFDDLNRNKKTLRINLTRRQIEHSPTIDSQRPVSRQYEEDYYSYYGWPAYWDGSAAWGMNGFPVAMAMPSVTPENLRRHAHDGQEDPHLRSAKAVSGYSIEATDGVIGTVGDFRVDDKSWVIGELVAEAGHWYSGKELLVPTGKIKHISYEDSKVFVNLTKADFKQTAENDVVKHVV